MTKDELALMRVILGADVDVSPEAKQSLIDVVEEILSHKPIKLTYNSDITFITVALGRMHQECWAIAAKNKAYNNQITQIMSLLV